LFGYGSCQARIRGSISLSPALKVGNFIDFMGGVTIRQHTGLASCSTKESECQGLCYNYDDTDEFGKIYDPKRILVRTGLTPCECYQIGFGYCTISENACGCPRYAGGYPKIFEYEFQNCNYNFKFKGHITKAEKGDPPVHNGRPSLSGCGGGGAQFTPPAAPGKATEVCAWVECSPQPNPDYTYYLIKTKTPVEYNPKCPEQYANIIFNNNKLTVNIGNNSFCYDLNIRENCPQIEVRVPNDKFTITNTINSECTECDVDNNIIDTISMDTGAIEFVFETRTAIVGTLSIEGDPNRDGFAPGGMSWETRYICRGDSVGGVPNCWDGEYLFDGANAQCGKSPPDSWLWQYALKCELNGSLPVAFEPCISDWVPTVGTAATIVGNLGKDFPGLATGSDNPGVKAAVIKEWRTSMRERYNNTPACFNHREDIEVKDLVEGIMPGTCSDLKFEIMRYPAIAWRQTYQGGETKDFDLGIHVAYFTYRYKRPKNLQDVFLGNEWAAKCSTFNPIGASSYYNMFEKFKRLDCQNIPSCYDNTIQPCDAGNHCCNMALSLPVNAGPSDATE
jgi:hypothetical protein